MVVSMGECDLCLFNKAEGCSHPQAEDLHICNGHCPGRQVSFPVVSRRTPPGASLGYVRQGSGCRSTSGGRSNEW